LENNGKKYCLDTSGLSNPLENMPDDIFSALWDQVHHLITAGIFAATQEIYDELRHLNGKTGDCIKQCKSEILLEIGENDWDWGSYINNIERMRVLYKSVISEYNQNRKNTVGLNDISIVALAKTLNIPVLSMESNSFQSSAIRMRIPQICNSENVKHLTFNDFLRLERIKT
jgi:hypothetical protein